MSNKSSFSTVGPFNLRLLLLLHHHIHSALSCVLLPTIKSAEGSLLEVSPLCPDLLDSPWTPLLFLFDPLLPLQLVWGISWSFSSGWGNFIIAVLLLFSPLALSSLDLPLLDLAFFDLTSFLIGGCGWMVGGLILVGSAARLVCTVPLPMTTSVRWSSSVCSLAKLTNTYKNEPALVSHG